MSASSKKIARPVLLTAFRPWGDKNSNMSEMVLRDLESELIAHGAESRILDVLYNKVDEFIENLDISAYSAIISLGIMRQDQPPIRLESRACKKHFKPDDTGISPSFNESVQREYKGSSSLINLPFEHFPDRYDMAVSAEAGAYLCEYLYFRLLEKTHNTDTKCVFIHISNENLKEKKDFVLDYLRALQAEDLAAPTPSGQ
ncbi:MAG: hypothetical protein ACLFR0_07075 [Alphaproteobacteria bacterium]